MGAKLRDFSETTPKYRPFPPPTNYITLKLPRVGRTRESGGGNSGKKYTSTTGSLVSDERLRCWLQTSSVCLVNRFHQSDVVEHPVVVPVIVLTECQKREEKYFLKDFGRWRTLISTSAAVSRRSPPSLPFAVNPHHTHLC